MIWAARHIKRTEDEWLESPHAIIDNKFWQYYIDQRGREYAANRSVRGAYQEHGGVPKTFVVKPKKTLKFSAKGVTVTAAVIKGKVRLWEYTHGSWNAETAAAIYKGPLLKAMRKAFPTKPKKQSFTIIEDNDPAGYKSGKAMNAKKEVGIASDDLPRRSPDLNVLDYYIWNAVNTRMRKQEATFPKSFKESKEGFLARLKTIALRLPKAAVSKAVASMRRRVLAIKKEQGGLIKE